VSADVAARIAADKATTVAATEPSDAGGWLVERGPIQWEVFSGKESATSEDIAMAIHHKADAEFIAAARTRWPLYVAAIEAVLATCDELEDIVDDEGIFSAATSRIRDALAEALGVAL